MILFRESKEKKELMLCWVPKWGPIFCHVDGAGAKSGDEIDKLNQKMWAEMSDFNGDVEAFHKKMTELAEKAGFAVKVDFFTDKKLDESLSADELDEFVKALKAGVVDFEFEKVDGTVRKAKGTLNQDLMKVPEKKVEGAAKKRFMPPTVQVFWDVEKEEFRSCRKASITKWKAEEKEDK